MLILVVDDEVRIRNVIVEYLSQSGHQTVEATNGVSALEQMERYAIDLVILDVMLPKKDGINTCKEIKEKYRTPVIMLSAKTDEEDRLAGFDVGADDYVIKPFSPKELVARVNAVLKRNMPQIVTFHGIKIDTKTRSITVDGQPIKTNRKEYELLCLFLTNVGIAISRDEIIKNVWGYELDGVDRTIDTHIKMLRSKMGKYCTHLITIRGFGYRLNE